MCMPCHLCGNHGGKQHSNQQYIRTIILSSESNIHSKSLEIYYGSGLGFYHTVVAFAMAGDNSHIANGGVCYLTLLVTPMLMVLVLPVNIKVTLTVSKLVRLHQPLPF